MTQLFVLLKKKKNLGRKWQDNHKTYTVRIAASNCEMHNHVVNWELLGQRKHGGKQSIVTQLWKHGKHSNIISEKEKPITKTISLGGIIL